MTERPGWETKNQQYLVLLTPKKLSPQLMLDFEPNYSVNIQAVNNVSQTLFIDSSSLKSNSGSTCSLSLLTIAWGAASRECSALQ